MSRRLVALNLAACAALAACAGSPTRPVRSDPGNVAAASLQPPELVRLRIGDGPVSDPMPHPALGKATLRLLFPPAFAGSRVDLAVDRGEGADRTQWMRMRPQVDAGGTLVVAGLPDGHYELRATLGDGVAVGEADVTAPVELSVAMTAAGAPPR